METDNIKYRDFGDAVEDREGSTGFSLLELLVVLAIISMLMAIAVPVFTKVRRHIRSVAGANNQRGIVSSVNLYAFDHDGQYPESVATVRSGPAWNWSDPTKLIANEPRSPGLHRAMSEYLGSYIQAASIMFCPKAPKEYKYLQQAWQAGDQWDNPESPFSPDPVGGTYCFYWNYIGFLEDRDYPFRGPRTLADGRRYSRLLVSDYFGYDHWRGPNVFIGCEEFKSATIIRETWLLSAFWSCQRHRFDVNSPGITLHAGYTDGHVERFEAADVVRMRVSLTPDGTVPYPIGVGPGYFFLPRNSLR
jgi:prepilin-type N-terminal cleavage/methylation domain-containing protein